MLLSDKLTNLLRNADLELEWQPKICSRLMLNAIALIVLIAASCHGANPVVGDVPDQSGVDSGGDRVLRAEMTQLKQKLSDNDQQIERLQRENAALRKRLGLPPENVAHEAPPKPAAPFLSSSAQPPSISVLDLPEIKWGTPAATDKHQLLSGIPGASIMLMPFDKTLVVKPISTARLALLLRKVSKSLGTESLTDAGSLWVQNGSLYLQWASDDQAPAMNVFKYASLEIRDTPGAASKVYSFVHPQTVAVVLNKQPPVKTSIPALLIPDGKLQLQQPSGDWQSVTEKDGTIELQNKALQLEIKLDPAAGVCAHCEDLDPNHAQRKLDALNNKYNKTQSDLEGYLATDKTPPRVTPGYSAGGLDYPPVVENRNYLHGEIQSAKEELVSLDRARPKLEAEVNEVQARSAAIDHLDGTVVELSLPNGIVVSQMTLQVAH